MINNFDQTIDSTEETVATMLPNVGLDGTPAKDENGVDNSFVDNMNDETPDESLINFTEAMIEYMSFYENKSDMYVEEGIKDAVLNMKTKINVSREIRKIIIKSSMLKTKIKIAEKKKAPLKNILDMKRELAQLEKDMNRLKNGANTTLKKSIKELENKAEKEALKEMDKECKKYEKEIKEVNKNKQIQESVDNFFLSLESEEKKDDKKEMSAESKNLDIQRGYVAKIERELEQAKKRYDETGEKIYENKIKGLTYKLEREKEELRIGEEKYKKEEEKLTEEAANITSVDSVEGIKNKISKTENEIKNCDSYIAQAIVSIAKLTKGKNPKEIDNSRVNDWKAREEESTKKKETLKETKATLEEKLKKLMNVKDKSKIKGNAMKVHERKQPLYMSASTDFDELTDEDILSMEKADLEPEIKDIVNKLNTKGYKVKYASPGHTRLRKKEDKEPDGIYYNKLYSDARIMFDDKYKFPTAPKYWHWRDVDGCSYLDITPENYDEKDGTPDEAFSKWKTNYMNSLRGFVEDLKPRASMKSESQDIESYTDDLFEEMSFEYVMQESTTEVKNQNHSLLAEFDKLIN